MWYYANSKAEAEALEVPAFLSCGHIFLAGEGPPRSSFSCSSGAAFWQDSGLLPAFLSC